MWAHLFGSPLASGFGSSTTAEQVSKAFPARSELPPQTVLITGASAGLGVETARVFALRGADVVLAVRDLAKATNVVNDIKKEKADAKLTMLQLDLSDLNSVRTFVASYKASGKPLDILIANAGVASLSFKKTPQGHELMFGTNHLGHFLLVTSLKDQLFASAAKRGEPARVVLLSSAGHFRTFDGGLLPDDKLDDPQSFKGMVSYGQSKLMNLLFARELATRWPSDKVIVSALHPGVILTELVRDLVNPQSFLASSLRFVLSPVFKTVPQGTATTVYCALSPKVQSGEYYADCDVSPSHPISFDVALGQRLWRLSETLVAQQ